MARSNWIGRTASVALAVTFAAATLAAARAQPAASHDHTVRTRTLAWTGGDHLFVSVGAEVRYVQGQNARVVVTGPADEIDDIVVEDGVIRRQREHWGWVWWNWPRWRDWRSGPDIHIVVTAPHIDDASVSGSGHLDLGRLSQDRLELSISGSGGVDASGQFKALHLAVSGSGGARLDRIAVGDMSASLSGSGWIRAAGSASSLHLAISGSGSIDAADLAVQDAVAHLSGSGSAKLSPKRSADLEVSGSGSVRLLTEPSQLNAHRVGSGAIIHANGSRD